MTQGLIQLCKLYFAALELQDFPDRSQALFATQETHVLHPVIVIILAQVTVTEIRNDYDDDLARPQLLSHLERTE